MGSHSVDIAVFAPADARVFFPPTFPIRTATSRRYVPHTERMPQRMVMLQVIRPCLRACVSRAPGS